MTGDAVTRIIEQAQLDIENQYGDINGQTYSTRTLHRIPLYEPRATPLSVSTLQGFVDFIKQNPDGFDYKKHFVHIVSHEEVRLCSEELGEERKRENPVIANLDKSLKSFAFGTWIESEMFIINLRSLFVESEDLARIIAYTGHVEIADGIQLGDDGISQTAARKRGLSGALREEEEAPVIVSLDPYRTFREIEQPESDFLFRMRPGSKGGVDCALFEADGGTWRLDAVSTLLEYMLENLPEDLLPFA